jgi:hypothetical protein
MVAPLQSLFRSVKSVSEHLAYDDLLAGLRQRFVNTYPDLLKNRGKMPVNSSEIVKPVQTSKEAKQRYNSALVLFDHIQLLQRTPTTSDKVWKRFMFSMADTLEDVFSQKFLSNLVRKSAAKGGTPISWVKKIPTLMFITMRPARQLFLQGLPPMRGVLLWIQHCWPTTMHGRLIVVRCTWTRHPVWLWTWLRK